MELKWLEDFLSLVETGNFSKSAEIRHVTQPAFSRRIKSLEFWLGTDLVDRNKFPITMTPAGRAFRGTAIEILRLLYSTRDEIKNGQRAHKSSLNIAALHSLAICFFPQWLTEIKPSLGDISIKILARDLAECMSALTEGSCDFFLSFGHPKVPVLLDSSEYPHIVLSKDQLVPVSKLNDKGKPLHKWPGTAKKPATLLAYTPGSMLAKIVEQVWHINEMPEYNIVYENSMAEALKGMVEEGHGIAWLPLSNIQNELESGKLGLAIDVKLPKHKSWETELEVRLYRLKRPNRASVENLWKLASERAS
ncbi:MAG: LysR family transcriptional regulator [Rhizobiales bacterium]|nr:LysR substrate-binding domain-containing protein [Hyphomicrobiales bacterium]NRB15297.1 LysR family transcriptional regulator [Hyphomicrobiales bacterium]